MSKKFVETESQSKELQKMLDELRPVKGSLMSALQKAQHIYGYLPIEVQTRIAESYRVPLEEVYGIVTFYTQFSLTPPGKYKIGVCLGTACYVRGAGEVMEKFEERLKIKPGNNTEDNQFHLEATRCIGCCGLAPVVTVNENVYGNVTINDVNKIIDDYSARK